MLLNCHTFGVCDQRNVQVMQVGARRAGYKNS